MKKTPIIRSYLGGGAIVVLFGTALLNYFNLLPALTETLEDGTKVYNMACNYDLVGNITTFFKPTGAFLDFYIAALITGSILGMNSTLLKYTFQSRSSRRSRLTVFHTCCAAPVLSAKKPPVEPSLDS